MKTGKEQYILNTSIWPKNMDLPDFPSFKTTTSAIDFSPNNKYLVTGHPSQKICLWLVANGDKLDCWQVARKKAYELRKNALEAYLEAENIKNKYSLENMEESDDENRPLTKAEKFHGKKSTKEAKKLMTVNELREKYKKKSQLYITYKQV